MKRICALLLAVCSVVSGCGTETAGHGQSLGQTAEQMMETECEYGKADAEDYIDLH